MSEETASREMPYAEALRLAMALHWDRRWDAAEKIYRSLRELDANDPNAMHFFGVLLHQRGRHDEGMALIVESLKRDPGVASWHNNLGNALLDAGRLEEAAQSYARSSELAPEQADVRNNLGCLLRNLGRHEEAEAQFREAMARDPELSDAHSNLATLLAECGRMDEGLRHFARALELRPRDSRARRLLGVVYVQQGRLDEAAQVFREWLAQEPGNVQALHHLAAVTGEGVPERCTDDYVADVFDRFAGTFDHKLAALGYQAPGLAAQVLARRLPAPAGALDMLDAGCGTGLCAPHMAPHARSLVGVDLSEGMLAKAAERGAYQALHRAELVAWLRACTDRFDVIVSADTLCYFGRVDELLAAAKAVTRPGGLLVFTVENLPDAGADESFRLLPHGRYGHRREYVDAELARAGWQQAELEPVVLRHEGGQPVNGWLASAVAAAR